MSNSSSPVAALLRRRLNLERLEDRTALSGFAVTNLGDAGAGSLRQAVLAANAHAGPDLIFFAPGARRGLISLSSALPALTGDAEVLGPGAGNLTVRRGSAAEFRLFTVDDGKSLRLSGLTLANGAAGEGGAVLVRHNGALTVSGCVVTGNSASSTDGGGVSGWEGSSLNVRDTTFTSNRAYFNGGALACEGTLTVRNCTFANNSANHGGGAFLGPAGSATVAGSTFSNNDATNGHGGGIGNQGTMTVRGCTLKGNSASGFGGGLASWGALEVSGTTLAGNSASYGGGVYRHEGAMTLTNCTVVNNSASRGGGVGLINSPGPVTLASCTVVGNHARDDSPTGIDGRGGGLYNYVAALVTLNTIIYGNDAPYGADVYGNLGSTGSNLLGTWDPDYATGKSDSDLVGEDPELGPLQDNGGPTFTLMPALDSPAVDGGAAFGAPATDQRGASRDPLSAAGLPDIGAVEATSPAAPLPPVVLSPAAPAWVLATRAASRATLAGTAGFGSLVKVWLDLNGDGQINGADRVVAQANLSIGTNAFRLDVQIARHATTRLLVTATDLLGRTSDPAEVPPVTEASVALSPRVTRLPGGRSLVQAVDALTGQVRFARAFPAAVQVAAVYFNGDGHQDLRARFFAGGRWFTQVFSGVNGLLLYSV
ncbi:MAG: right-handed parallel beta-helix repeat-containing protein [Gemmataceae bacterium]